MERQELVPEFPSPAGMANKNVLKLSHFPVGMSDYCLPYTPNLMRAELWLP
jgi:hypothetical protein